MRTTRLGDYEIGGVVAHGLVGVVREGLYVPGARPVILEEIPAELAADTRFTRRLADAGRAAAAVTSTHLLATHDVVNVADGLYVASEPPRGPSLAALSASALTAAAVTAIACDVLDGLASLHGAGIHHGSVGLGTVWVDAAGQAALGSTAIAATRNHGSASADLEAVTTITRDLWGRTERPGPVMAALKRAPGTGSAHPFKSANEYRDALAAAAATAFGRDWRRTSGLAEAARVSPQGTPAIDLAAVGRDTKDEPIAMAEAPPTPPPTTAAVAAPRRRRGRLLIILGLVIVLLIGAGVGVAVVLDQNAKTAALNAPLALGSDLHLTVTPAQGGCNTTFGFVATASTTGTGALKYEWVRSDGTPSVAQAVQVTPGDGSFRLTAAWRLGGSQKVTGTMTFKVLSPGTASATQTFGYSCS